MKSSHQGSLNVSKLMSMDPLQKSSHAGYERYKNHRMLERLLLADNRTKTNTQVYKLFFAYISI